MLTAATLLQAADHGRPLAATANFAAASANSLTLDWAPDSAQGEQLAAQIIALRRARHETPVGYKIGFTNRAIWPVYGVDHPIWGRVYDSTVRRLLEPSAQISIAQFCQPRLEPEIVFGIKHAPASPLLSDVVASLDWYAHGFEVVHSIYPDWKFSAAQAVAAQGLHGALLVGPARPIAELTDPVAQLANLQLELRLNGKPVANGCGSNVLDGPVQALAHLVAQLARRGETLRAGELITTGTLTDAMPLVPGQLWQTVLSLSLLPGLALAITQ